MLIDKNVLADIKARHDLAAFVASSGVELKKVGAYFTGRCPFHEDDKPSLVVNPIKGLWNCLGACRSNGDAGGGKGSSGGDVLTFAMKLWAVDFREAVKRLGGDVKDELPPPRKRTSPGEGTGLVSRAPRTEAFGRVVESMCRELFEQRPAQEYLESRGLVTRELWRVFRLGYSSGTVAELAGTEEAGELGRILRSIGVLTGAGEERMKGRVVFPLLAFNQLPVGLYGRSIDEAHEPHHLYLPGPRRGLFNWGAARRSKEILFTEAPIDTLSLCEAGVLSSVPLYGAHGLTDEHKELVTRCGVTSVVVALDADEAGQRATPAVVEAFAALGVAARAITWPEKDPNVLLLAYGPKRMREIVEKLLASPKSCDLSQSAEAATKAAAVVPAGTKATPETVTEAISSSPLTALSGSGELARDPEEAIKEEKHFSPGGPAAPADVDPADLGETLTLTVEDRHWRILWGESRDPRQLKATARVRIGSAESAPVFLDTLDLVPARSREAFARRAAAQVPDLTDAARTALEKTLRADLVTLAERGETRRQALEKKEAAPPVIPAEEKLRALRFLADPRLLGLIATDLDAMGYVGEDTNKKLGYLVSISRKLDAALSMVILSTSGSGKSGLAEVLEALTPEEELLSISRLTPQALYYMPKDSLRHKFVLIEERAGSQEADYSIRALQSKKRLTLAVPIKDPATGRIETKVFEIYGPAAFLEATTESEINVENATRCFEIHLDESVEQTRRIQEAQRWAKTVEGWRARTRRHEIVSLHKTAQRLLKALPVVIPYAWAIEFPSAWIRTRRDNLRFLHLIEVLAFLHQYQRPLVDGKTGERVSDVALEAVNPEEVETLAVEATLDDYALAYDLSADVFADTFQDLSPSARELHGTIERHVTEVAQANGREAHEVVFTRRLMREKTRLPNYRIKALFHELEEMEYVTVTKGGRGATSSYRLVAGTGGPARHLAGLLSPAELAKKLERQS